MAHRVRLRAKDYRTSLPGPWIEKHYRVLGLCSACLRSAKPRNHLDMEKKLKFLNWYSNSIHNSSILPLVRRKRVSLIYDFTLVYIV